MFKKRLRLVNEYKQKRSIPPYQSEQRCRRLCEDTSGICYEGPYEDSEEQGQIHLNLNNTLPKQ